MREGSAGEEVPARCPPLLIVVAKEGRRQIGGKKKFRIQLRQIPSRALQPPKKGLGVSRVQAQSCRAFPHSRVSANVIPYQGCTREEGKARSGRTLAAPRAGQCREQRAPPAGSGPGAAGEQRPWGPGGLGCEAERGVTLVTIAGWSVFFSETCLCNLMYFRNCRGVRAGLISGAVFTATCRHLSPSLLPFAYPRYLKYTFIKATPRYRLFPFPSGRDIEAGISIGAPALSGSCRPAQGSAPRLERRPKPAEQSASAGEEMDFRGMGGFGITHHIPVGPGGTARGAQGSGQPH